MTNEERAVATSTAGLALTAVGAFLPWSRIGGRARSGFDTADTFIGLSEGVLPDSIAWVGRWWYIPAFLAVLAWATAFFGGRGLTRAVGVVLVAVAFAMWWLFVWAGHHWDVLDVRLTGPSISSVGLAIIVFACTRPRSSLFPTLANRHT